MPAGSPSRLRKSVRRVLILFTSEYPYGSGETFVSGELPFLTRSFDRVLIMSNDTQSDMVREMPPGATARRLSYELSAGALLRAPALLDSEPRSELQTLRRKGLVSRVHLNTVLAAWVKATHVSRILRQMGDELSGAQVVGYAYWANDMALAVAMAKAHGWIDLAVCRAHRWDVYGDPSLGGYLPFRRYLAENLDHYRFVSQNALEYFRAREGRDFPSLGVSTLGTPPLGEGPIATRAPFLLVSCSHIIARKRVDRIAAALAHVERPLVWLHIGEGPERHAVEMIAAGLPPHIRVEMPGHLSPEDLSSLYRERRPSLFVSLSDSEGVPVAIMEAMSAGMPVVATAVGGIPEIVTDGQNGRLLSVDHSAKEFRAALNQFTDMSDGDYRQYSDRAFETWRTRFNASNNYPAFVNEVLGASPTPHDTDEPQ